MAREESDGLGAEQERRLKRLKFRSWHRGTRELDLLLGPFADRHLDRLSAAELAEYEALLERVGFGGVMGCRTTSPLDAVLAFKA